MSTIQKNISPFIEGQFPSFYREEGPNFIAFVKAYYEWLEQTGNIGDQSRSLLEYTNIDRTTDAFLSYFKHTFIANLPETALADKRLLVKHILDLYRTKGTPRSYELLFQMLFGEKIELYIPGDFLFKPSDNKWTIPCYIELSDHPLISTIVGTEIASSSGGGLAIVESISRKIVNGRSVNVANLSSIRGVFPYGDRIYQPRVAGGIRKASGPFIIGSLNIIQVKNGGSGYNIGDRLSIFGSGVEAQARVSSVSSKFGVVSFSILDGGYGYTTNADVSVVPTLDLFLSDVSNTFNVGDTLVDTSTNANGFVTFANSTYTQLISFSPELKFVVGDNVTNGLGTTGVINRLSGGVGSGASFKVGSVSNASLIEIIEDLISPYVNLSLDSTSSGLLISTSSQTGTFTVSNTVTSTANVIMLDGVLLTTGIANGESLSNTALGISNLYCYKADGGYAWCTANNAMLTNANLAPGVFLVSNTTGSILKLIDRPTMQTITGSGTVVSTNSTSVTVNAHSGYFIPRYTLSESGSAVTANIASVTRLTNWRFPSIAVSNLDSTIDRTFIYNTYQIGTIESLSFINPGADYQTPPFVTVRQNNIADLYIGDGQGGFWGSDAEIIGGVINGRGSVTAVEVIDSGFGYVSGELITMKSNTNPIVITGYPTLSGLGKGTGYWSTRNSFVSDIIKIQDSYYYQDYSYELIVAKMFDKYESLVKSLVHPSGMALFGRYRLKVTSQETSKLISSSLTQT